MNQKNTITTLHDLYFSENKPADLKPIDLALLTYLVLRQTEDHFIHDSQLTLANRLGCKSDAVADSIKRLKDLGWITTKEQWQWNEKTKNKTRVIGGTVGLAVNVDKLPQSGDRARHARPSKDAIWFAAQHTGILLKSGVSKRRDKNFDKQQQHAAQRLIEEMGSLGEAADLFNFALSDARFKKVALKSLYEVRSRLSTIRPAFEATRLPEVKRA